MNNTIFICKKAIDYILAIIILNAIYYFELVFIYMDIRLAILYSYRVTVQSSIN